MHISRVYVDQVAVARSLAESVAAQRSNPKPIAGRRESLSGTTGDRAPPTQPARWMAVFKQTLFGLR
jgi:hypothetical protein